mmetsp:Transcript_38410/g.68718  ORF Transcript_38410/g.68718 Transcript_38410/m.68718 type:complete len:102 (-) Transcript_38410:137-442(-)
MVLKKRLQLGCTPEGVPQILSDCECNASNKHAEVHFRPLAEAAGPDTSACAKDNLEIHVDALKPRHTCITPTATPTATPSQLRSTHTWELMDVHGTPYLSR